MTSKDVEINGEKYQLDKTIVLENNKIKLSSTSIEIDDEGEIKENSYERPLTESKSRLSLHGIEVPSTLFPETWGLEKNQVKLSWPFPLLLVIDISEKRDLDLNSSRTQILLSDKWDKFEEDISFIICSGIAKSVPKEYWDGLKDLLIQKTINENFLNGLKKAKDVSPEMFPND